MLSTVRPLPATTSFLVMPKVSPTANSLAGTLSMLVVVSVLVVVGLMGWSPRGWLVRGTMCRTPLRDTREHDASGVLSALRAGPWLPVLSPRFGCRRPSAYAR